MNRIIVKGTNWIGDVCLSLPAVYALRHMYPNAVIDIALKRPLGGVLSGLDVIDGVVEYSPGFQGERELVSRLRRDRYDLGVIFPRSLHAAALIFFARARRRLGYAADMRSLLLTDRVERTKEVTSRHQSEYYRHLVSTLGDPGEPVIPRLSVSDREREEAKALLYKWGWRGRRLIGVNPGAAYGDAKRWYTDRFAQAADIITEKLDAQAIVFGGPLEVDVAEEVSRYMKRAPVIAAGRTTIRQLLALIDSTDLFITNDTGPMHLAAALNVPLVAVFGSTNSTTTSPMAETGRFALVRHEVECSPCLERSCPLKHHRCMELVEVGDVVGAALSLVT
ncbi:MAG: lipopolysaccharide heptosyltransferase II [Deltaproteobacteria bacterium]|nr:lipopolysaccharide heptosyltransferase II [Candidatus Zymogenaceae bacterium]